MRTRGGAAARIAAILAVTASLVVAGEPAAAGRPAGGGGPRTVTFAGRQWLVKESRGRTGPGPNYFSASTANVEVDGGGALHLRITKLKGRWYCAEVILQDSLGYGTYTFDLASPVDGLDPNVVLGMFTWHDNPAENHREIDVEMARWGNAADPTNAQYVVQPWDAPGHQERFTLATPSPTRHRFTWAPGRVAFESRAGATVLHAWAYEGADVPTPGGENPRMNLWLFRGAGPSDGQPVEVVVSGFEFAPPA